MRIQKTKLTLNLLAGVLLLAFGQVALQAQFDSGSIVGEVHDATGAVLPGAAVSVVNKGTGATFTAVSGSAGQYEVPSLRTGTYKISASHSGFSTAVADNITVSVGERQHLDLTLQVGQSATTVEVSDVQLQIQTESSQRDQRLPGTIAGPAAGKPQLHRSARSGQRCPPGADPGHHHQQHKQPCARRRIQRQRPALRLQQLSA